MRFLLDTNVVSELRKGEHRRDGNVTTWARDVRPTDTFLSVITVLELRTGIERRRHKDPAQAQTLSTWLAESLLPTYRRRILDVDQDVAKEAALLHVPDPQPSHDALIAATAKAHGLTVATRNESDFAPMGVPLVNPWGG